MVATKMAAATTLITGQTTNSRSFFQRIVKGLEHREQLRPQLAIAAVNPGPFIPEWIWLSNAASEAVWFHPA